MLAREASLVQMDRKVTTVQNSVVSSQGLWVKLPLCLRKWKLGERYSIDFNLLARRAKNRARDSIHVIFGSHSR